MLRRVNRRHLGELAEQGALRPVVAQRRVVQRLLVAQVVGLLRLHAVRLAHALYLQTARRLLVDGLQTRVNAFLLRVALRALVPVWTQRAVGAARDRAAGRARKASRLREALKGAE